MKPHELLQSQLTRSEPVAYSSATCMAIAEIEKQIQFQIRYADSGDDPSWAPERCAIYASITGLAIALTMIAKPQRQWDDFDRWSQIQSEYYRLSKGWL